MFEQRRQDAELRRVDRVKHQPAPADPMLGDQIVAFFKQSVAKRQAKFGRIAEAWGKLVPSPLADHCALESLSRGSLTVLVDSASHLYEMKQLLLAGLEQQLLLACRASGLRKIALRQGQWYDGDAAQDRKPKFD